MRKLLIIMICCLLTGCIIFDKPDNSSNELPINKDVSIINSNGMTIKERFLVPEGFVRVETDSGSFEEFLQTLPLKIDGSKVMYFDGRVKSNNVHAAVIDWTLGNRDLQQCADAIMRLRAEWLYATGQQSKIRFNFVSGFTADFKKWSDGYGILVNGNNVSWVSNSRNNGTYESFQRYLDIVYTYANTYSLEKELVKKDFSDVAIGDVFIIGGFPGHAVIVVDMLINKDTGAKHLMIAQSYMPAQDIHILKGNSDGSPWFTTNVSESFVTPEWTFELNQLRTWQ